MGWSGFDFAKAIRHLLGLGVTRLAWDGRNLTWEPPSAQVHVDVGISIQRSRVDPFIMDLKPPGSGSLPSE